MPRSVYHQNIAGSWRVHFALLSRCLLLLVACGVKHSTEPLPLTPLGLVLFAPPLLPWPALMRVRASQKATTPDNRWLRLVGSLQESTDHIERESIYFGQVVSDGSPVIVPREVFREHAHFLGDSGSGKTSLGTFGFNPLQQPFWPELELYQKTDVLCGALGLRMEGENE